MMWQLKGGFGLLPALDFCPQDRPVTANSSNRPITWMIYILWLFVLYHTSSSSSGKSS